MTAPRMSAIAKAIRSGVLTGHRPDDVEYVPDVGEFDHGRWRGRLLERRHNRPESRIAVAFGQAPYLAAYAVGIRSGGSA